MRVELKPATSADIIAMYGFELPLRVRASAAWAGDELLGGGGLTFMADGTGAAFMMMTPHAFCFPVAMWKAAKHTLAEARRLRINRIVALAQHNNPAAVPFLERLGFQPIVINGGETAWVLEENSSNGV